MYNSGKIITGAIIALILLAFPIWYIAASGEASYVPEPEIVTDETQCIESTLYMRKQHMTLLADWKVQVVREIDDTYVASDGQEWEMSLTGTCLSCHPNKDEFCGSCHDYMGVNPNCWNCHVEEE